MNIFLPILIASAALTGACSTNKPQQTLPQGAAQAAASDADKQWHCEGNRQQQWYCSDLSQPEHRLTTTQAPLLQAAATATTVTEKPAPPVTEPPVVNSVEREKPALPRSLMDYPADYYAVQLIAAHKQRTIDVFRQQHSPLKTQQLSIHRDNQRWHLLILGIYPSVQAATEAIARIQPPLTSKPWIRRLGPLQQSASLND